MTGTRSEQQALLAELQDLYKRGLSRKKIYAAFKSRRGKTWICERWPGASTDSLERLRAMHRDGRTLEYALRKLAGEQSDLWVRQAWQEAEHAPVSLYGGQDVVPSKRYEPRAQWSNPLPIDI